MKHSRSKLFRVITPALALLTLAPLALTACSSDAGGSGSAAGGEGGEYVLKVTDPGNHGWLAVAQRDGVLEKALEPLDATVEWVPAKGAVSANLPLFGAGEIQVSEGAFTPVVGVASQNPPIKIGAVVASDTPRHDSGIVATEASGVDSVGDLTGKSIAVNPAGKGEYIVLKALEEEGLSADEVDLQYLQPSEAVSAFKAGQVDAIASFGEFFRQAQESGNVIVTEVDIDSQDTEIILFTNDLLEDRPDIAQAVVEAAVPLVENRAVDPEDYVNVFEDSGARAIEGDALEWQIEADSTPATLRFPQDEDRAKLQSIIDLFVENGVVAEGANADDIIADLD